MGKKISLLLISFLRIAASNRSVVFVLEVWIYKDLICMSASILTVKMNPVAVLASSVLFLLVAGFADAAVETNSLVENATQAVGRSGRKEYSSLIYSPPDAYAGKISGNFYPSGDVERSDDSGFEPIIPRVSRTNTAPSPKEPTEDDELVNEYQLPPRFRPRYYIAEGPMPRNDWNAFKGDLMDSSATSQIPENKGGPPPDFNNFFPMDNFPMNFPMNNYKGDSYSPDQMYNMMMMMNQMQKPKMGGFLSKITKDPLIFMIVAVLPLSLILSSVLPTLVNMMMNGGLPTITTTATGNNNKARYLENVEFLKPVLATITTFAGRSFDNTECMQKIFCQVTKGPSSNGTESRSFQRALYSASRFVDSKWLENFGVKTLFDSMADGNCDKIPCSTKNNSSSKIDDKKKKS